MLRIDSQPGQTFQIQLLNIVGSRFQDDLILILVLHAIGVFPIATVRWTTTRLCVGSTPRFRTQ